jgi:glutamate/tyrosine decarboxylase-like PLP-dependent enzyme
MGVQRVLKQATIECIEQLHLCDSITIDPHKGGFIQYQAGALVYCDQRMKRFVTSKNSIAFKEPDMNEVYGIEER